MSEIQLISGQNIKLSDNSTVNIKNGLMSDIFEKEDNLEHIMIQNDIDLTSGKSINCSSNILNGVLEETLLSKYFFSDDNMINIQKMIRYYFYKEKNKVISDQSNLILLTIMRGIFLKYSDASTRTMDTISKQIIKLNEMVTEYSLKQMYSNFDMYYKYLAELERRPDPHPLPVNTDTRSATYNLSKRNDISGSTDLWSGYTK